MKILVPIKRVIDYSIRIRIKSDGSGVETSNVKMSMNPFDEIALEEAVRQQEAGIAQEVVAVTLGTKESQETLRTALAMGATRAILIETASALEPLHVAKLLQKLVAQENPNLILMGKQAIDDDCNQTGQMLAALLHWPQATFASKLIIEAGKAIVTREIDGGLETIAICLPGVVTTDLRLNQPRYISLPKIMQAKNKPLQVLPATDLGVDLTPHLITLKTEPPPARKSGVRVASVAELIEKLKQEGAL